MVEKIFNFKNLSKNFAFSFSSFFKEKTRPERKAKKEARKRSASQIGLSQLGFDADDSDDDVFNPGSSAAGPRLRSQGLEEESEEETNTSSCSASEVFKKQRLSFDSLESPGDLRGFSKDAYSSKTISLIVSYLMQGEHAASLERIFKRLHKKVDEFKEEKPMSASSINEKRLDSLP
jgi:hypothetical protein